MSDLKIFTENIEDEARQQIELLLKQQPFKDCKVRIMPDVHAGKGCVIGFTADLKDKVIPNIVGVDIGCGMLCIELGKIELNLEKLDKIINNVIPSGRNIRKQKLIDFDEINNLYCLKELKETKKFNKSIGTLGGGNHFIEVDVDDEKNKYLVIHTGSRNLGKQVADYYQNLAIELCSSKEEIKLEKEHSSIRMNLPKELCYLTGKYRERYLHDMKICQKYAQLNRLHISKQILNNYFDTLFNIERSFETIHNYIAFDDNIVK